MAASAGQHRGLLLERLAGIEAKLDRAAEHLELVQELGHAWISSEDSWHFSSEVAEDARRYIVSMRLVRPVPRPVLLAVDEAIHHLRSSLDHLASYLVEWSGGQVGRAEWPSARSRAYWQRHVERRRSWWQVRRRSGGGPLAGASPAAREFVRSKQPFVAVPAGASLLELDKLWNTSKHQVVNPIRVTAAPQGNWSDLFEATPAVAPVEFRWLLSDQDRLPPEVDRRLAILVFPQDLPLPGLEVRGEIPATVFLGDDKGHGRHLDDDLELIRAILAEAVDLFPPHEGGGEALSEAQPDSTRPSRPGGSSR